MKIAIPTAGGNLALHFGHCESFTIIEVDDEKKSIISRTEVPSPPYQPGLLPVWLAEQGVNVVIAGGMGERAKMLFDRHGIQVLVGAPAEKPENVVQSFLMGTLELGTNVCDH